MRTSDQGCATRSDLVTVGEIFRYLGKKFLAETPLNGRQIQAFRAIAACRTAALGGAVWHCTACGHKVGVYHSCRDRHCPQCQAMARFRWVKDRLSEVLPVPYFHTVFTLPHQLNFLVKANKKLLIGCLFRAVSNTLKTFARDPKHLGAEPGYIMVLHTWGRQLNFHPHIHCIITGGGLSKDRDKWVDNRKKGFLFSVKAMSAVFRGKFLDEVEALIKDDSIYTDPGCHRLMEMKKWQQLRGRLCRKKWVVYAKPPFGGPAQVIKYLGAYTHRVGIANSRLVSLENGVVRFRYKDYKNGNGTRILALPAAQFARRFLEHILPNGMVRIRYGGFLASCKKRDCLEACRRLFPPMEVTLEPPFQDLEPEGENVVRKCAACGQQTLIMGEAVSIEAKEEARRLIFENKRGPP